MLSTGYAWFNHAAYDLVKGGDQPYPAAGTANGTICGVDTDPVCKDSAVKSNIGGGFEVEDAFCLNNTDTPVPGLPAKYCYILGYKGDLDKGNQTDYDCWLFTSLTNNKATLRCTVEKDSETKKP
ncbi:hypothetical protein WDU94_010719 [Cyamophila willieti]